MLNKKNFKKVIITILALTMVLGTVAFAADSIYTKKITATYGKVKINFEGSDVTKQIEQMYGAPAFIAENKTYVPVRSIGDLVGVDIEWDEKTNTAFITDPKIAEHKRQLNEKDKEIALLELEIAKFKKAEKEEVKKEEEKKDLKSLQASLNKKYSEYEKVEFDIVLKENGKKITIDINTNLANTRDDQNWIRMRYSDKKYLMEDVVDQVKKEFKDADISGNIYDSFSRRNLHTFKLNTNGNVSITDGYYGGYYGDDYYYGDGYVDRTVRSEFDSKNIYDARLIKLDYRGRDAYFEIDFSKTYEDKWKGLENHQIISMLDSIAREIIKEYDYNYAYDDYYYDYTDYVDGKVYMGSQLLGTYRKDFGRNTSATFIPANK